MKYYKSKNFLYKIDETKPQGQAKYHILPHMEGKREWRNSANRNSEFDSVMFEFITEEDAFEILL